MLSLTDELTKEPFYIWAYEEEKDNNLVIITSRQKNEENLWMIEDEDKAQYFSNNNFDEGITYAISKIEEFINKDFKLNSKENLSG